MQFTQAESFPRTCTTLNVHSDSVPGGSALVRCSPSHSPCFPAGHPFLAGQTLCIDSPLPRCQLGPQTHRPFSQATSDPVNSAWKFLPFFFFFFKRSVTCFQSLSQVRLFATPRIAAHQASLSSTISQSLLRPTCIESVKPSNSVRILNSKCYWKKCNLHDSSCFNFITDLLNLKLSFRKESSLATNTAHHSSARKWPGNLGR